MGKAIILNAAGSRQWCSPPTPPPSCLLRCVIYWNWTWSRCFPSVFLYWTGPGASQGWMTWDVHGDKSISHSLFKYGLSAALCCEGDSLCMWSISSISVQLARSEPGTTGRIISEFFLLCVSVWHSFEPETSVYIFHLLSWLVCVSVCACLVCSSSHGRWRSRWREESQEAGD